MPEHPPIRHAEDLDAASPDELAQQFRYEVHRLAAERGWKQLHLAQALDYSSTGYLSRWLTGKETPPRTAAEKLDRLRKGSPKEGLPHISLSIPDLTFVTLHERWRKARRFAAPKSTEYDVFLASPMDSAVPEAEGGAGYAAERSAAMDLARALLQFCGFRRVYYAGQTIESTESFESPTFSIELNAQALYDSRYFVLLTLSPPRPRSGIYVEAGLALAFGKPSVYFLPSREHLPWMLETVEGHRSPLLPRVAVEPVDSVQAAVGRLRGHGKTLFTRLDES